MVIFNEDLVDAFDYITRKDTSVTSEKGECAVRSVRIAMIRIRVEARMNLAQSLTRYGSTIRSAGLGNDHSAILKAVQYFEFMESLEGMEDEMVFDALEWLDKYNLQEYAFGDWYSKVHLIPKLLKYYKENPEPIHLPF
jgi:hypothetical protein